MLNLTSFLDASAFREGTKTAVIHEGRHYSFAQLRGLANRVAQGLRARGFHPGDRIAVCCCNRPGFLALYFGALRIGAELVILGTTLKARDVEFRLRDSGAKAFFVQDGYGDAEFARMAIEGALAVRQDMPIWIIPSSPLAASPLSDFPALSDLMAMGAGYCASHLYGADDMALVMYTSGSTGRAKGVVLTHANLVSLALVNQAMAPREDTAVRLIATPFFHIPGQMAGLLVPIMNGETIVLLDRFDPERVWHAMEAEGANFFFQMPIYYKRMLENAGAANLGKIARSLRLCVVGGANFPVEWAEEFHDRVGAEMRPCYGMTEVSSTVSWNWQSDPWRPDCMGRVVPGVEVELRDPLGDTAPDGEVGEVWVRSPGNMLGYLNMPELTAKVLQRGWYGTGDLGRMEPDGSLMVIGRADDRIHRGEEQIYPAEVENLLMGHPLVRQAAVVAVPDTRLGEEAKTCVVLERHADFPEPQLLNWLSRELPLGKCPGLVEYHDSLPMTDTGKVARHLLV